MSIKDGRAVELDANNSLEESDGGRGNNERNVGHSTRTAKRLSAVTKGFE